MVADRLPEPVQALNWNINDFDVYRVRVEYPLMYTKLWAKFEAKPVGFGIEPHIMP